MQENILSLNNITKSFDGELVLEDLSLEIKRNEFVTLLGPSGCGKTTTLRIIAGFVMPDQGSVLMEGEDITTLPTEKRCINTVFQKYALFPHMTVAENIAFGLKIKKKDDDYISKKIKYALELVNLTGFEKRKPRSLSGGQQQRIAIARAIVNEPQILLLDEPLGALDLKLRQDMQKELIRLKKELGITFIYVTHDQEEALTMSDKIVVMNQGYIQQIGTPEDIYNEPQNAFVADFIGSANLLAGTMIQDELVSINDVRFDCVDKGFGINKPVDVVIRPEDVEIREKGQGIFPAVVTSVLFKGVHYEIFAKGIGIDWMIHTTAYHEVGAEIDLYVKPFNIQIMNKPESEDEAVIQKE
ncbi:MAG: ABC transporter ATP-binding protein [Lachnospiraceae bacterium]|nr:ABC transporter ATP-binding protein [Lachnospiraceae bacterium]